jgi:hypothetical protein
MTFAKAKSKTHVVTAVAKGFPKRAGDLQLIGKEHHAGVGAPPQNRVAFRIPGKNAPAITFEKPPGGEAAARGEQPVRLLEGALDRRKGRVLL